MIVERIYVPDALVIESTTWPWSIPAVRDLVGDGVALSAPVTFLVGENGTGKSTIVEAVAEAWGVDVRGGPSGRKYSSELRKSVLGEALRFDRGLGGSTMVKTQAKGFFLRSETALDVFQRLGYGDSYTAVSHGESYLQVFEDSGSRHVCASVCSWKNSEFFYPAWMQQESSGSTAAAWAISRLSTTARSPQCASARNSHRRATSFGDLVLHAHDVVAVTRVSLFEEIGASPSARRVGSE